MSGAHTFSSGFDQEILDEYAVVLDERAFPPLRQRDMRYPWSTLGCWLGIGSIVPSSPLQNIDIPFVVDPRKVDDVYGSRLYFSTSFFRIKLLLSRTGNGFQHSQSGSGRALALLSFRI